MAKTKVIRNRTCGIKAGDKFGQFVVLAPTEGYNSRGFTAFLCRCRCGNERPISAEYLRDGRAESCGCLTRTKHGMSGTPEYDAWTNMKMRCGDPNHRMFRHYGARGITVCDEWAQSFEAFYRDVGPRPRSGMSLERVDNDEGYTPGNCVWATQKTQIRNRRNTLRVIVGGVQMPLIEAVERLGLPFSVYQGATWRIRAKGISPQDALRYYQERAAVEAA